VRASTPPAENLTKPDIVRSKTRTLQMISTKFGGAGAWAA